MRIQFVSDLHLEFRVGSAEKVIPKVTGDILILAGDICVCGDLGYLGVFEKFLEHYCQKYQQIIHVAGNHEYYTDVLSPITMRVIQNHLRSLGQIYTNYHFLHNKVVCIDRTSFRVQYQDESLPIRASGLCIIGSTLWTNIPVEHFEDVGENMNDYSNIFVTVAGNASLITPKYVTDQHMNHAAFIRKAVRNYAGPDRILLVTHHKPYISPSHKEFSTAYQSNFLERLPLESSKKIRAVIYGHTHKFDNLISRFPFGVFSNPKGYPNQNTGFVDGCVIDL
jgi:predicted phosphodiesterase